MRTSLDEWEILQAVVNQGGFAAAAEQLNRSQSTVSYAIGRQEKLGVKLFEQRGRKAHLTESGRLLLAEAEPHLAGFRQIEQRAGSLASGGQSEIESRSTASSRTSSSSGCRIIAVAHRDHPLQLLNNELRRTDMFQHTMALIEGSDAGRTRGQPGNPAQRLLPVSTIEAAIDAVRSRLCFGWLPSIVSSPNSRQVN